MVTTGSLWGPLCIKRIQGECTTIIGDFDAARRFYDEALSICDEIGLRPEGALTHLGLAELLLEHYPDERDAAIEHLDFAIEELTEMKMQPALERALRHKGMLKA